MRAFTVVLALVLAFAVAANAQEFEEQSWSWSWSSSSWSPSFSSWFLPGECVVGECCWGEASACVLAIDTTDLLACDTSDYECGCPLAIDYYDEALACFEDNDCDGTDPIVGSSYTDLLEDEAALYEDPYNCPASAVQVSAGVMALVAFVTAFLA